MTAQAQKAITRETVWDYSPDGTLEPTSRRIRVVIGGVTIADTTRAIRALEKGIPPDYYIPVEDVKMEHLQPTARTTFCEFKGTASYYTVKAGGRVVEEAAWSYGDSPEAAKSIEGYIAFYPNPMDACYVDDEQVSRRSSDYYAGWVTSDIEGPFVGDEGVDFDPLAH